MNKGKVIMVLMLVVTLFSACVGKEAQEVQEAKGDSKQNPAAFFNRYDSDEVKQEKVNKVKENGSIIFETEYEIEDYCNGIFIVSKSNGLLYGVVDLNGQEILPVKYDAISFENRKEVAKGEHENVYIKTTYEGQDAVYDAKGNKLFDEDADIISYEREVTADNAPFWVIGKSQNQEWENTPREFKLYREDGTYISSIQLEEDFAADIMWVDDNICLISESIINASDRLSSSVICLRYTSGEVLKQWGKKAYLMKLHGLEGENYYRYICDENEKYSKIIITADGNMLIEETELTKEKIVSMIISDLKSEENEDTQYHLGENKENILYQTNKTWKYEDESGNPIYDQRYFSLNLVGSNSKSYALSNEDNQVCIITKNGRKTVDYGYIELDDSNSLLKDGLILQGEDVFTDFNSVCIVVHSAEKNQVYYWES